MPASGWKCGGAASITALFENRSYLRVKSPSLIYDSGLNQEAVEWATDVRNVFPLPFGRGEGQGEGIRENTPTGRSFLLTPALSPSAGERENHATATVFCRSSQRRLSTVYAMSNLRWANLGACTKMPAGCSRRRKEADFYGSNSQPFRLLTSSATISVHALRSQIVNP